jgi:hypothetical protein
MVTWKVGTEFGVGYLVDVPGQFERIRRAVVLGSVKEMSKSEARRRLKEKIAETGINSCRIPSTDTFARQVEKWMETTVAKCKVSTQKLRPKSRKASRRINVKPYGMQMLREHLKGRTEGLVFQSRRRTPLQNCTVLHKHLHPPLRQLGLEQGGMHAFRHHRVSTLVMAGTPLVVIKKWIGHGSE